MKNKLLKGFTVILVFIMIFSCLPLTTFNVSAFWERNTAPDPPGSGYFATPYNSFWNGNYSSSGNCTWYAFGRAQEILGGAYLKTFSGNAKYWYGQHYPTSQTPHIGDIACWAWGTNGHVAIVEGINSDGTIRMSESSYGGPWFTYHSSVNPHTYLSNFQGYIHYVDIQPDTVAPSNVSLALEKTSFYTDEHVTYYCSANNASYYYVSIYDKNGNLVEAPRVNQGEYLTRYYNAGTYTAYCEAYNSIGHTISNTLTFTVKNRNDPQGYVDSITGGSGKVSVGGWVFDRDDLTKSLDVHVYIGGSSASTSAECYVVRANLSRKDIDNAYSAGEFHGYDTILTTKKRGNQDVYVYAINIGGGENVELGHAIVNITNPEGSEMTSGYDRVLDDGLYIIANAASPDFEHNIYSLDIEGIEYPAKDSTNVSLYGPVNIKTLPYYDMWEIAYQKDGFYTIKQPGTNVSLDIEGASILHAANIIAFGYNGGSNQLWAISKTAQNGINYRIQAKCSGMSVDVNNGGTVNGTNIVQARNNDSAAQSWVFIKHNHSYGAWSTVTYATCTQNGSKKRVCQYCGLTQTETIPATGHNYNNVVTEPTCTTQGYSTHTCQNCNNIYVDSYTSALEHSYGEWEVINTSSCVTDGLEQRVCTVCGKTETRTIPAHHTEQLIRTFEPTCTVGGYDYVRCTVCGARYQKNFTDPIGHNYLLSETVAPTCTEGGYDRYCCDRCGDTYTDNLTPALVHNHQFVRTVNPTCTEQGYDLYRCERCEDTYTDNLTAALGHNYQFTRTVAATCINEGYHLYTCTRCGGENTVELPALGHYFVKEYCLDCGVWEKIAPYDINGDTELNAADLSVLVTGLLTDNKKSLYDCNGDGNVNILDLIKMKKEIANM